VYFLGLPGGPLGRVYPWGKVEVENPKHNDFVLLRSLLFGSHIDELRSITREELYEKVRGPLYTHLFSFTVFLHCGY
jgi:septin family protein